MRDEDPLPGYGLDLPACASSHDPELSCERAFAPSGTPSTVPLLALPCPRRGPGSGVAAAGARDTLVSSCSGQR